MRPNFFHSRLALYLADDNMLCEIAKTVYSEEDFGEEVLNYLLNELMDNVDHPVFLDFIEYIFDNYINWSLLADKYKQYFKEEE